VPSNPDYEERTAGDFGNYISTFASYSGNTNFQSRPLLWLSSRTIVILKGEQSRLQAENLQHIPLSENLDSEHNQTA